MATAPVPIIDSSGIYAPDYPTVHEFWKIAYRTIYGQDVSLDNATQDGQWVALIALAMHESNQQIVSTYNTFSPSTAQGNGLSRVVKINGLARKIATYSTVDLKIIGQAGIEIVEGQASNGDGTNWLLPPLVTIPLSGEITVTAQAAELGAVTADPNSITEISTPTFGWQSVSNPASATPGAPIESDADLRRRQSVSTALPSRSLLDGLAGAIAAIAGVTRSRVYENDSFTQDTNGLPGHTIAAVVEGGDASEIARILAAKKGSANTAGSTVITLLDSSGTPRKLAFFRPTQVSVNYVLELRALPGFSINVVTAIQNSLSDWTNNLSLQEDVTRTRAFVPANLPGDARTNTFEILTLRVSRDGRVPKEQDIPVAFNERAVCAPNSVIVRVPEGVR